MITPVIITRHFKRPTHSLTDRSIQAACLKKITYISSLYISKNGRHIRPKQHRPFLAEDLQHRGIGQRVARGERRRAQDCRVIPRDVLASDSQFLDCSGHILFQRHCRLPHVFFHSQILNGCCSSRQFGPGSFRTTATVPNMGQRCRLGLFPRLFGAIQVKFQRVRNCHAGANYCAAGVAESSAFKLTALILPRLSCSSS